jgi:hypothetical protein
MWFLSETPEHVDSGEIGALVAWPSTCGVYAAIGLPGTYNLIYLLEVRNATSLAFVLERTDA